MTDSEWCVLGDVLTDHKSAIRIIITNPNGTDVFSPSSQKYGLKSTLQVLRKGLKNIK